MTKNDSIYHRKCCQVSWGNATMQVCIVLHKQTLICMNSVFIFYSVLFMGVCFLLYTAMKLLMKANRADNTNLLMTHFLPIMRKFHVRWLGKPFPQWPCNNLAMTQLFRGFIAWMYYMNECIKWMYVCTSLYTCSCIAAVSYFQKA